MRRYLPSILAITAGVLLGLNVLRVEGWMAVAVIRNSIADWVTNTLSEQTPNQLLTFWRALLYGYFFAPYFLPLGIVAGWALSYRTAAAGALMPLAYALTTGGQLMWTFAGIDELTWYDGWDYVVAVLTLVPIYLLGVHLGRMLAKRRRPRATVWDLLTLTLLVSLVLAVGMSSVSQGIPFAIAPLVGWLAWRTRPRS